jgi:hypothetical protein
MNQSYEKSLKDDNFWLSKYLKYKKKYIALKEYLGGAKHNIERTNPEISAPSILHRTETKIKKPITELYPIIIVTAHGSIKHNALSVTLSPGVTMIKSLPGVQMRDDLCPNILQGIRKLLEKNEGNINTKTILTGINLIYEKFDRPFLGAEYKGGELYSDLNLSLLDPTEQQQTGLQINIVFYNSKVIEHTIDGLSKPIDFGSIYTWIREKKRIRNMVYNNTYVTLLIWTNNVLSSLNEGNNIIQNENTSKEKNKIIKTSLADELGDFLSGTLKYIRVNIIIRKIIMPIKGYIFVDVLKLGKTFAP